MISQISKDASSHPQENQSGRQKTFSGLLALAQLARRFGIEIDNERLLRDARLTTKKPSASDLMRLAGLSGISAVGLKLDFLQLRRIDKSLPSLVILKNGEAMIISSVDNDAQIPHVTLQDPCCPGEAEISFDRRSLDAIWAGEVVLLRKKTSCKEVDQKFDLSMIAGMIFHERRMVRDIFISALMLSLLALLPILFFRVMGERVLPFRATSTYYVVCCVSVVLVAFEIAFGALRRSILLRLTTRIDVQISTQMFKRVLRLPSDYFERTPAGITLHRIGQLGRVRNFLVGQLFGTVLDAGILLFFVPVMLLMSPLLTGIVLGIALLMALWIILMLPAFKAKSSAVETAEAQRGAFVSQSIQGIRTVKTLALEVRQAHEWDVMTANLARLRFQEGRIANLIQVVVTTLERSMVMGSFGIGVYTALQSNDPAASASLFVFMLLSQRLAAPLIQASQFINQFDEARTAIAVVGDLVNLEPEESRITKGVTNEILGHVTFSSIQFQYKGSLRPALKDVTFEIPQGATLGVMGRSGSGKTTITRLLQRLSSEYSGSIKIDGVDIRNFDLKHFRSSLGVVLQENFLFSGTIRSNIMMAKPDADITEVVNAARLAGAEEFIEKLPNGYETYIYEGSPNLSGGQRQRLAIARALITDPKILILDEATSALDAESEAIVNANIERISQGRTVITISHRLASLVKADAILVMEQGEVNDIGKHHELLERNEIYANLWYTQNPHTAAPATPRPQLTYKGPQSVA